MWMLLFFYQCKISCLLYCHGITTVHVLVIFGTLTTKYCEQHQLNLPGSTAEMKTQCNFRQKNELQKRRTILHVSADSAVNWLRNHGIAGAWHIDKPF